MTLPLRPAPPLRSPRPALAPESHPLSLCLSSLQYHPGKRKKFILQSAVSKERDQLWFKEGRRLTAALASLAIRRLQWGLLWSNCWEEGRDPFWSLSLPLSLPFVPPLPLSLLLVLAAVFSCLGGEGGLSLLATIHKGKQGISLAYIKYQSKLNSL